MIDLVVRYGLKGLREMVGRLLASGNRSTGRRGAANRPRSSWPAGKSSGAPIRCRGS